MPQFAAIRPASSRLTRWLFVIAAVTAAVVTGWWMPVWRAHPTLRPNILLITLDTTRADHLGAYGYAAAQTPTFDRLAAEGVLFERAVSAAPITLPAHVSLLTARYPFAPAVRNNGNFRVADDLPTLATRLHDHGYRTAAFVSAFVLDRRSGLSRGFDQYDDHFDAGDDDVGVERRGDRTGQLAEQWIAKQHDDATGARAPLFVWVLLY